MRLRKVFLLLIGMAVASSGLYGFGTNLPATHQVVRKTVYHQPREAVWEAISHYENAPQWSASIARVEQLPEHDGMPVWRLYDRKGGYMDIQVVEMHAPNRLVSHTVASSYPYGADWTIDLEDAGDKTLVTLSEEGNIKSPIWRLILRYLTGEDRVVRAYLQDLGQKFGEIPHIVG